jgi:hypothetical protein
MTISPDRAGGRKAADGDGRPLRAVSPVSSEAAGTVVRVALGPSQWALVAQPAGVELLRPPPVPARPFIRPLPGDFALVRIPWLPDSRLGTAVLVYRPGHTLVYCPEHDITERAASVLSALACPAIAVALGSGHPEPHLTFSRIGHSQLPADDRHVASAEVRGCDIVFEVCSGLISAALADTLGLLCTAHARDLLQLGQLGTDQAVGRR